MKAWNAAGIDPQQFPNHDPDIHGEDQLRPHEARRSFKTYLEATDIRDSRIDRYMAMPIIRCRPDTATSLIRPT
jgi:hypothetical protein